MDFPGKPELIAKLDHAMQLDSIEASASAVEQALIDLWKTGASLPVELRAPAEGGYARCELHASHEHGYSLVAMIWPPGVGTPLHDHDGLWGVECVWQGRMQATPYRLVEQEGDLYRFDAADTLLAHPGDAGGILPPDDHHVMHNPSDTEFAVSLHFYCRRLERCRIYVPSERPGWLRAEERQLALCD